MPSVGSMIQFKAGLYENYAAISAKDANTIYFCTDTQQMFIGESEYTRPVISGAGAPTNGDAKHNPPRTLYFDSTDKNLYVTLDDGKWVKITDSSIAADLAGHINNKSNPHGVTTTQIGAATKTEFDTHATSKSNPHAVTAAQVGLGNVDNTADADKPVSTLQAAAIADAKKAGTDAQEYAEGVAGDLTTHTTNTTVHITGDERTTWNAKVGSVSLGSGTKNGTVKLTVDGVPGDDVSVTGLKSAAYTDSDAYATKAQGTKADNAMPKSGGTFNGEVVLNADPTKDLGAATKQYVDSKTAALTGAMHFVGVSTTDPAAEGATVAGHTKWAAGDVVLYGNKEYVLKASSNTAANWVELGDEGSHALKTIQISAGGGLTGGGDLSADRTISHAGKAAGLTDVTKTANTFVSGMTFDSYGHPTAVETTAISGADGVKVEDNVIKHTNSVTAQNSEALLKVKYDAQGHITGSAAVTATDIPGLSGKQDQLTTTQLNAVNSGITSAKVGGYDTHLSNTKIHVTEGEKKTWNEKQDALVFNTAYNAETNKVATMADVQNAALVWGSF